MRDINEAIFEAMDKKGYNQAELSRRSGVSKSSLSRYLGGDEMPATKLAAIADALGMTVDELLGIKHAVELSPDESELIALFRASDARGREQLLVFARGCAASYPLNQENLLGA